MKQILISSFTFLLPYLIMSGLGLIFGGLAWVVAGQMHRRAECREGGHQWDEDEDRELYCKHCGKLP